MNFEGNNNQGGLTIIQTTSFINVWGCINHAARASLIIQLRGLVQVGGDIPARNQQFRVIELLLLDGNGSMEHSVAVNNFLNVLHSLPLRCFPMMHDLAEGQPIPQNDPQGKEREVQTQEVQSKEVQGPIMVSESNNSSEYETI